MSSHDPIFIDHISGTKINLLIIGPCRKFPVCASHFMMQLYCFDYNFYINFSQNAQVHFTAGNKY